MQQKLDQLRQRLRRVADLHAAAGVLHWDQTTYMPPAGAEARGRQIAMLEEMAHREFTDPQVGALLESLAGWAEQQEYDSDEASLLRVTRRDYDRATRVSTEFIARAHAHAARSYQTWTQARPADDFAAVRDNLRRTLDLSREYAGFFPECAHPLDALIQQREEGLTAERVRTIFAELRQRLMPLVDATADRPGNGDWRNQRFPEAQQLDFALHIAQRFGYDLRRGRQDKTHHPFMTRLDGGDVRITTRVREDDLTEALFSTLHETGHALYEQGVDPALDGTPLGHGASSAVHESQSRLWENLVGRSYGFWRYFFAELQRRFPAQLGSVALDDFYRSINRVQRSLIRTDADEVTYNLHVIIRFDLEWQLLEGELTVDELPCAWRERYRQDIGVAPPDDRDGVLQDVHWYGGLIGGCFVGYALGNIMAAQFFAAALEDEPSIPDEIEHGRFDSLRRWLTENVYRHGRKYVPEELLHRATGAELSIEPYMRRLTTKFGEIYDLSSDTC